MVAWPISVESSHHPILWSLSRGHVRALPSCPVLMHTLVSGAEILDTNELRGSGYEVRSIVVSDIMPELICADIWHMAIDTRQHCG
jgi:hypothetical protein